MLRWSILLAVGLLSTAPALAQDFGEDDDEPLFGPADPEDGDEPAEEAPPERGASKPGAAPPADAPEPEDDDVDYTDPEEDGDDGRIILDDEEEEEAPGEGEDTSTIYRAQTMAVAGMEADEEVLAWEAYLEEYPASLYRDTIQARIDALLTALTRGRDGRPGAGPGSEREARRAELLFHSPLHMTNVNPRSRIQASFEFGFPFFPAVVLDAEIALLRQLSVHAGFNRRYAGWGLEVGTRGAFVKSAKDQLVFSGSLDLRVNFGPTSFQIRPQLAFGKIFGPAQLLLTFGSEIDTRPNAGVGLIGGAHVNVRVAQPVGVFVETDFYARNLGREGKPFLFQLLTFGLTFYPKVGRRTDDPLEISAAGNMAVGRQYTQYYFGAIQAQANYYLPSKWLK